jgi:hypothetical protein
MEDVFQWILWLAIIGGGVASSVTKARKKHEQTAFPRPSAGGGGALEELWRALSGEDDEEEKPHPRPRHTVVTPQPIMRPVLQPVPQTVFQPAREPEATSFDTYSLENEYEERYVGGEFGSVGGEYGSLGGELGSVGGERGAFGGELSYPGSALHSGGAKGSAVGADRFESEIAAYERLAEQRAHRSTLGTGTLGTATLGTTSAPANGVPAANGNDITNPLQELLGGDFDLRRAVIEREILTPKYVDRY